MNRDLLANVMQTYLSAQGKLKSGVLTLERVDGGLKYQGWKFYWVDRTRLGRIACSEVVADQDFSQCIIPPEARGRQMAEIFQAARDQALDTRADEIIELTRKA